MIIYILLGLAILLGFYGISIYNRLVRMRNEAEEAFKTIDVFPRTEKRGNRRGICK